MAYGSALETVEDLVAATQRLRRALDGEYILVEIGNAEEVIACAGGYDKSVVVDGFVLCCDGFPLCVDMSHFAKMVGGQRVELAHFAPERECDTCGIESCRCYLVEQWRKAMVIVAVDESHIVNASVEMLYQIYAGETASDYHYLLLFRHDK